MNCIIVIQGVTVDDYLSIREDLTSQFKNRNKDVPLFALLPADFVGIEAVWIDKDAIETVPDLKRYWSEAERQWESYKDDNGA